METILQNQASEGKPRPLTAWERANLIQELATANQAFCEASLAAFARHDWARAHVERSRRLVDELDARLREDQRMRGWR